MLLVDGTGVWVQRPESVKVGCVTFVELEEEIRAVRDAVFGVEQGVPPEVNWDGRDADCVHVVARLESGKLVGAGRLEEDGKIGRLAVFLEARRKGVGSRMLECLTEVAQRRGLLEVYLHAQTHALAFYEGQGFCATGNVFLEAEIEHCRMSRRLVQ